jgi:hypothetical protein
MEKLVLMKAHPASSRLHGVLGTAQKQELQEDNVHNMAGIRHA